MVTRMVTPPPPATLPGTSPWVDETQHWHFPFFDKCNEPPNPRGLQEKGNKINPIPSAGREADPVEAGPAEEWVGIKQ